MTDDLRQLRRRHSGDLAALANRQSDGPEGVGRFVGTVRDGGAMPSSVPAVYLVEPEQVSAVRAEGGEATFTGAGDDASEPVIVVGPQIPSAGARVVAERIGGHWVAEYGRPGETGAPSPCLAFDPWGVLDCPLPAADLHLNYTRIYDRTCPSTGGPPSFGFPVSDCPGFEPGPMPDLSDIVLAYKPFPLFLGVSLASPVHWASGPICLPLPGLRAGLTTCPGGGSSGIVWIGLEVYFLLACGAGAPLIRWGATLRLVAPSGSYFECDTQGDPAYQEIEDYHVPGPGGGTTYPMAGFSPGPGGGIADGEVHHGSLSGPTLRVLSCDPLHLASDEPLVDGCSMFPQVLIETRSEATITA